MLLQIFSLSPNENDPPAFLGYVQAPDGLDDAAVLSEACDQLGVFPDGLAITQDETGAYLLSRGYQALYSLEEVHLDST